MITGSTMGLFWIWPAMVTIGLVLLGYLAYRLVQGRRTGTQPAEPSSARRNHDKRYACGQIGAEDYRRRRGELP